MMVEIVKTLGTQVNSPVAEGKRIEEAGRRTRDLHQDTY